ncbi:hypothetical protein Taro_012653, partial [Colocasia esculenta]|nr:hypothetical protein [Colocasia esculenta]
METPDNRFSELVDLVKSWIPRTPKPANVSRDFWMPDHSCRVCYECDSQFTILNRRHHCRLCGRVFCGKCTANSVSIPSSDDFKSGRDESERIRVCNYCFKQREQDLVAAYNENPVSSSGLSPSLSAASLASIKSSGTANSSSTTGCSTSYTTGTYQRMAYSSALSPGQTASLDPYPGRQEMLTDERSMDPIIHMGEPSPNHFGFCMNRSDDEEDEYCACRYDTETQQFHQSDDYYGSLDFTEVDHLYGSHEMHPAEENDDKKELSSLRKSGTEFVGVDKLTNEGGTDNVYECDTSSSIYNVEAADSEPVDFESNGLLWLPPDPEDEEDEREASLFDDDDEDASGDWGNLHSSNSFGSGELRSRDRASEEHRRSMKHVVDGHFRALVSQLLQVENLPISEENDKESWLEIITALSWDAATLLKPDTSRGDGMDPGGYLKIKCIACGHRSESMVVKGIVCKKNVAHRRMTTRIEKPRLLLLGGALEYQRKANLLSSVDTLLQQEMDHLKMAVARIDSQHPNVLLVEKSVSRFAQDYLLAKGISLALNMKRPLLDRIARCTGAQIVPSIDNLSPQVLGYCDSFHVEKRLEEHGSAGQGGKKVVKNLMFFEGCPKPLGCTVLLKGANGDELKKVKHVIQYAVFAAYHLALETSFLADEGASLPEFPLKSPLTVALPDKPSKTQRSISMIPGFTTPATCNRRLNTNVQRVNIIPDLYPISNPNDYRKVEVSVPSLTVENHLHTTENSNIHILNSPPFDPKLSSLGKISQLEHGPKTHKSFSLSDEVMDTPCSATHNSKVGEKAVIGGCSEVEILETTGDTVATDHIYPAICYEALEFLGRSTSMGSGTTDEREHFGFSQSQILHQEGNHLHDPAPVKEDFSPSPSDHQSILVSLSSRCVRKGTVCERAHIFRIKYYGSFDKPLGRFLRDHLFDQGYRCHSCDMPSEAHVHCYTHRQGSLTISVKKLPDLSLPGERDGKIWMWHRCLRCPRVNKIPQATRRVVMSDAAWGLSFGKFLELSFSNHAATSRVASCGHSLHRDCLRFYGFGKMVACFRYASIDVHSVYLPPPKLDFKYQHQGWIQKEADEVAERADLLFSEVLNALRQIAEKRPSTGSVNNSAKLLECRHCIMDLERILQKEKAQCEEFLQKAMKEVKKGQSDIDILEINKLRRQLLFQSYVWDKRLVLAASLENHSHEGAIGLNPENKEKINSAEKPVNLNCAPKPDRIVTSSLSLDPKADESFNGITHGTSHQKEDHVLPSPDILMDPEGRDIELNSDDDKHNQNQAYRASQSMDIGQPLDPLVSGGMDHRTLSDGQFPIIKNLSDSLDAKWTGENGAIASEVSMSDSSVIFDTAPQVLGSEEHSDDQDVVAMADSLTMVPVTDGEDSIENDAKWIRMPFMNLYQSFGGNNGGTLLGLDASSDCTPVYMASLLEPECQGGARLLLPFGINNTVIPVYDDEPTSIISYALVSPGYHSQMADEREQIRDIVESSNALPSYDSANLQTFRSFDEVSSEYFRSMGSVDESILSLPGSRNSLASDPLLHTKALHIRVSFAEEGPLGKVKYTVTCYHAKRFDALRRTCCPSELDFIRSLSRCKKWGAQGGKSNVFFAKSLDDRFIIKQVTKTELESFIQFAPEYFKYLSESISSRSPTCLAKILGIYQVMFTIK